MKPWHKLLAMAAWIGGGVCCMLPAAPLLYVYAGTEYVVAECDGEETLLAFGLAGGDCVEGIAEAGCIPTTSLACNSSGCSPHAEWLAVGRYAPVCQRFITGVRW